MLVLTLANWLVTVVGGFPNAVVIIPPLAASAGIVFLLPTAPVAQPRNVILGNVIGAFIGVSTRFMLHDRLDVGVWLSGTVAVTLTTFVLDVACVPHPPALATSLVAVSASPDIIAEGFMFVLVPCATSSALVVLVALVINNAARRRTYPQYWLWEGL